MNWYLGVLKKYAEFNGRARRREYWIFQLFNFLVVFVLVIVDAASGNFSDLFGLGLLSGLYLLAVLLPCIAVSVRRLHDTDRSGWWVLLAGVPFVGAIVLIIFFLLDGTPGKNRFGESPKQAMA